MKETADAILAQEMPFKGERKEVKCDGRTGQHLNPIDKGPCSHEAKWMSRH